MDLIGPALLSGLVAGVIAIAVTRAIEKCGGVVGGVLATIPSTIVPASIGLASRLRGEALTSSLFSVPPGMLVDAGFLLVWRLLPAQLPVHWTLWQRLGAMVAVSLTVWFVGAAAVVSLNIRGFDNVDQIVGLGTACCVLIAVVGVIACFRPLDAPKGTNYVSWTVLACRGGVAFVAITVAVLISKLNDVAAGFATTFPAIFLTTMASIWISQSAAVSIGATGPMVLGSVSVAVYACVFAVLVERDWNPYAAAAMAWALGIVCCSVPVALFLRWRQQQTPRSPPPPVLSQESSHAYNASVVDGLASQDSVAAAAAASSGFPGGMLEVSVGVPESAHVFKSVR